MPEKDFDVKAHGGVVGKLQEAGGAVGKYDDCSPCSTMSQYCLHFVHPRKLENQSATPALSIA